MGMQMEQTTHALVVPGKQPANQPDAGGGNLDSLISSVSSRKRYAS